MQQQPGAAFLLMERLRSRDIRADFVAAEPPDVPADGVNIWPKLEPEARYPWTTVYAPTPGAPTGSPNSQWVWGPNFEHRAEGYVDLAALEMRILLTLPDYWTDR